jgi:hypothetical protein
LRHTLTAKVRQALPADATEADYRYYRDDWDLSANSLSLGLALRHAGLAGLGELPPPRPDRHLVHAPAYTGTPEFFTADFRLFPFDSNLYTGRVVYQPSGRLFHGMFPEGSAFTLQYEFYNATTGFEAATVSTGLRVPFTRR